MLEKYKTLGYDEGQLGAIRYTFLRGCTIDIVDRLVNKKLVNPEYNEYQLFHIIYATYINHLSDKQVSIFARPEFTVLQMDVITQSFKLGLSIEQVETFANPALNDLKMIQIRQMFLDNAPINDIKTKIALFLLES